MLGGKMGIDLRGGDVGVAEQFLDRPQVSATAQHMGGKAVPQSVGADLTA